MLSRFKTLCARAARFVSFAVYLESAFRICMSARIVVELLLRDGLIAADSG
jgi:hypothetical protein